MAVGGGLSGGRQRGVEEGPERAVVEEGLRAGPGWAGPGIDNYGGRANWMRPAAAKALAAVGRGGT